MRTSAMRKRPPTGPIATAYSAIDLSGSGDMVIGIESAPLGISEALLPSGTIVDVRAIRTGYGSGRLGTAPERELMWLITLLGACGGKADHYQALDDAREALRDDIAHWRILPGSHPGRPAVEGAEPPLEAALREFRERTMLELEEEWWKAPGKRRAERARSGSRVWWKLRHDEARYRL